MTTSLLAYIPSPAQGVWHLGPVPIRAYALCIITGIIAALIIGDRRWVARGGEPGVIYDIALWTVPFGLIGGRLYHLMTDWRTYFAEGGAGISGAVRIWDGGLGIWGAVALGGVGAWIGCRRHGIPLPAFADAIAPGVILAQAIGRLGNYFNQELYGRPTDLPWGLEIEATNPAFPVGLPSFIILAYSDEGDNVFDPFSGSGSTIIACERTGRRGFGCEISPSYCDVIVARWERETGKKAQRSLARVEHALLP